MKILTVLRSGGDFLPEHVARIRKQVIRHHPLATFQCLTDVPGIPGAIELEHDWPGWWAKMELFKIEGPVLYLDLDTTIKDNLRPLLDVIERNEFSALRDLMPGATGREMGSGVMGWSGSMRHLYDDFAADPERHMSECSTPRHWGDQGFIEPRTPGRAHFQDTMPGAIVSYKLHCRGGRTPRGARLICHHGKPRPWEI